jgi:riboflavin synthase
MFTGIVETTGTVKNINKEGTNYVFWMEAPFAGELFVNQSVSHNGVCLTVTDIKDGLYSVTAVEETLSKTNLGDQKPGSLINLERCMTVNSRFDGHIVQGHVDQVGICDAVKELEGSWLYDFSYDPSTGNFLVEKGSITIDGVSLTVFNVQPGKFRVTIIPHTIQVTNFKNIKEGVRVNLEFDIIGKYIQKLFSMGYEEYLRKKIQ